MFIPHTVDDVAIRSYLLHLRLSRVSKSILQRIIASLKRFYDWAGSLLRPLRANVSPRAYAELMLNLTRSVRSGSLDVMSEDAKKLLDEFDALPQADRQQVLAEILRRAVLMEHDLPDEADFVALADEVFLDLDRRECEE